MTKSNVPLHVKYLQTMVECLYLLGKVAAAGAMIWYAVLDIVLCTLYLFSPKPGLSMVWIYEL